MQHLKPNSALQGGKYKIEKVLGQGGFGITYLAEQVMLGRKVAVKEFFMKELCERDESTSHVTLGTEGSRETVNRFREKFLKEARNIARLNHPNIVRIIDVFEENGTAYYVMEYAENGSLADKVKKEGYLSEPVATRYILQVTEALDYVHQQKMNHLDVKPANIMLNEKDESILIDFGLSKQYDAVTGGQTSSTPVGISEGYAPMEQYMQGGVGAFSPETDIYSLGATYYKLLTGITPPNASFVNNEGLPTDELETKGISDTAISVICKAMESRKRDRMKSVHEFISALKGQTTTPVTPQTEDEATLLTPDNQRLEEERKRKEAEAKRIAEEKAEAERKTKAEAERKAREEEENRKREVKDSKKEYKSYSKGALIALILLITVILGGIWYLLFGSKMDKESSNENDPEEINYVEKDTIYLKSIVKGQEAVLDSKFDKYVKVSEETVFPNDYMIYTGDVKDGIPNGKGEALFSDGRKYVGEFKDGLFNDEKGLLTDKEGFTYEASFVNGYLAKGKYTLKENGKIIEIYEGNFVHNNPCTGTFYDEKGRITIKIEHGQIVWFRDDETNIPIQQEVSPTETKTKQTIHETDFTNTEIRNTEQPDNSVYENVDQMPSYPGGLSAYSTFMNNNMKYPSAAQENGTQGRVVVSFVVEKNGTLSNFRVQKSVSPELDREALRVLGLMPNFIPGKKQGKEVRVQMSLPVTFRLQ